MRIILGTQSPRRVEILRFFSLPFSQAIPLLDERSIPFQGDPEGYARQLAELKGTSLQKTYSNDAILTADTVVHLDDTLFGKPRDTEEAIFMLQTLGGRWHTVTTGVTLTTAEGQSTDSCSTRVLLRRLTDVQLHSYIRHNRALDKAGGYAIQGKGNLIVEKIEGCFYNVMGLPIQNIAKLFKPIGYDLWDYI